MSVWITSLVQTREVIQMILDKYKVESEPDRFAIFVVKDNGGEILILFRKDALPHCLRVD